MHIVIKELKTGKEHKRKLKKTVSCSFGVEGSALVVRNYYTGEKLQSFNISRYGSVKFWAED